MNFTEFSEFNESLQIHNMLPEASVNKYITSGINTKYISITISG